MGQERRGRNTKSLKQKGGGERERAWCVLAILSPPESQLAFTSAPAALGTPPASISYSPRRLAQAAKWATVGWANRTLGAGKRLLPGLLSTPLNAHHLAQGLARGRHSALFVELKARPSMNRQGLGQGFVCKWIALGWRFL